MNEIQISTNNGGGQTDLPTLMKVSEMLAQSDLVPASYRGKPANVLLAAIAGQPFGFDPTMAMRSFNVIQGSPTLKPEIMLALVRKAGHSVTGEATDRGATITGRRADTGDEMTVTFTEEDAKKAGLLGKGAWKTYPSAMMWARALSKLGRMLFPDVLLGCSYTSEELDGPAFVDGDAVADDRTSVSDAKTRLVEAFDGDKDAAKEAWIAFGAPTSPLTDEEMADLLSVAKDRDVIDAVVVDTDDEADVVEEDANV